jgi:hypothetical protein
MKVIDIIEEGYNAHAVIQRCYEVLSWSGKNLSDGNYGMAAYAVADFLNSKYKIPVKMTILSKKIPSVSELCQLNNFDPTIYRILVKFGSGLFDETGPTNINKLLNFIERQYNDDGPDLWNNIDIYKDSCVLPIIGKNTDWDTDWRQFKEFLERKFK